MVLENFAQDARRQFKRRGLIRAVVVTGAGDQLGVPRGPIVNLVLASYPARRSRLAARAGGGLQSRACAGASRKFVDGTGRSTQTTSRFCSIQAARPASPRARAHAQEHHRQSAAGESMGPEGTQLTGTSKRSHGVPLYHIYSLTVNALTHGADGGRDEYLDRQSARHRGLIKALHEDTVHRL